MQKKALEKKEKESKAVAIQVDDVLSFRQFSKRAATDGLDDVCRPVHSCSSTYIDVLCFLVRKRRLQSYWFRRR